MSSAATSDVVDASLWVSQLVPGDAHHAAARQWLDAALAADGWTPVVPALALPEVAVAVARRTGVPALGEEALAALRAVPGLRVVALDASLGEEAGRVAARLGLRAWTRSTWPSPTRSARHSSRWTTSSRHGPGGSSGSCDPDSARTLW